MAKFIEGIGPYTMTGELKSRFLRSTIVSEESGERWIVELPWRARKMFNQRVRATGIRIGFNRFYVKEIEVIDGDFQLTAP